MIKTDLPLNQLPTAISNDIKQGKYAGWKIEEADTIGRAGMGTVYKVEVEKAEQETDLYYTLYGDLIKAVDNAKDDVDRPISVPEKVADLMELTFQGAELLDIENTTSVYSWQSSTGRL